MSSLDNLPLVEGNREIERLINELQQNDQNAEAWFDLGRLYEKASKDGPAIRCYETAIEQGYNRGQVFLKTAWLYKKSGALDRAEEMFKQHLRINSSDTPSWDALGSIYMGKAESEKGYECYRKAIELAPNESLSYINMGYHLIKAGDVDGALPYVIKAMDCGDWQIGAFNRAHIYLIKGDEENAAKYYTIAARKYRQQSDFWNDYESDYPVLAANGISQYAYNKLVPIITARLKSKPADMDSVAVYFEEDIDWTDESLVDVPIDNLAIDFLTSHGYPQQFMDWLKARNMPYMIGNSPRLLICHAQPILDSWEKKEGWWPGYHFLNLSGYLFFGCIEVDPIVFDPETGRILIADYDLLSEAEDISNKILNGEATETGSETESGQASALSTPTISLRSYYKNHVFKEGSYGTFLELLQSYIP